MPASLYFVLKYFSFIFTTRIAQSNNTIYLALQRHYNRVRLYTQNCGCRPLFDPTSRQSQIYFQMQTLTLQRWPQCNVPTFNLYVPQIRTCKCALKAPPKIHLLCSINKKKNYCTFKTCCIICFIFIYVCHKPCAKIQIPDQSFQG